MDAIREVNDDMPRRWLFLPIHPGNVKAAAMVFDKYRAAANGDPSGLWLASLVACFVFPEVVNWGDNASKAVSADYDPSRDYAEEMVPEDPVMGAPLGRFLWGPAGRWPIEPIPEEYRRLRDSDVETLILSGSFDFTTPAENAKEDLLPHLPNGRQVVVSEMGHIGDLWEVQPKAIRRILTSFLDTGVPDDSLYGYEPMDFSVRWGYPTHAKLIVGGVLLAAVALISIAWLAVRFMRGRENRRT